MNLIRTILFSIAAGAFCLAGPAAARNTQDIVEATRNPARGGFALLAGDITGEQVYIVFSATTGGDGVRIVLPVKIDGQTGTLNVAFAAGGPAGSTTLLSDSVVTLLQGSVVAIDHTVTITGSVSFVPGSVVSIDHTVTVTGSVSLDAGTVVSIDHTVTVTGTVALGPGSVVSIDHTVTVTGSVALDPGQAVSIDHTVTVTGSVALDPGQAVSIDHTVTVTGSVALDPGQSVSIDHTVTVTGTVELADGTVVSIDHTVTVTGSVAVTGTVDTQEVPNLKVLEFSFTPLTALYQVGDLFGTVQELTLAARISGGGFMIHSVSFTDSEGNNPDVTLVLSDQTFTVTGDGTPFDPDDTEVQQFIGKITVVGSDWEAYSVNGHASKGNLGQVGIVDATSLFVALVINTNTTYAGGQTFKGRIYLIQE